MSMAITYTYVHSRQGEKTERKIFDKNRITIGRSDSSDLLFGFDTSVSSSHAELFYNLSAWYIRDTGSRLGTRVNNQSIEGRDSFRLSSGDKIRVGNTTLTIEFDEMQDQYEDPYIKGREESHSVENPISATVSTETDVVFQAFQISQSLQDMVINLRLTGQSVLKAALNLLRDAFNGKADHFSVVLIEGDELVPREFFPVDRAMVSLELCRQTIRHEQLKHWRRTMSHEHGEVTVYDAVTALYAPILGPNGSNGPMGVLHIGSNHPDVQYSDFDLELLRRLGSNLGFLIAPNITQGLDYFPSVFISYKHEDIAVVKQLEKDLRKRRIRPWFDEFLRSGEKDWQTKLAKMIEATDALIVVMSEASVASPYVMWEINTATEYGKNVFPVQIEEVTPPPALTMVQYIKLCLDDVVKYQNAVDQLVDDINRAVLR